MGFTALHAGISALLAAVLSMTPWGTPPRLANEPPQTAFVTHKVTSLALKSATSANLRFADLKVAQSSYQKVKTTGFVSLAMPKGKSSYAATLSFNPYGEAAATGKSSSAKLSLKWSSIHKDYRAPFTFYAKAPGALRAISTVNGKTISVSRNPARPATKISGFGPGTTYISPGSKAGAYVTLTPAYGRKLYVERLVKGAWVREQTIITDKNARSDKVLIWFKVPTNKTLNNYRVYAPSNVQAQRSAVLTHAIGMRPTAAVSN